jgi:hypothetical protein
VGRAPGGPTRRADIVPSREGFETQLRLLQSPQGIFTRPAEVADGFIVDGGDIDGGEVPRAHEPGELQGVPTVGFDPVDRPVGNQGGRDDPADVAFFGQIAIEPIPAWASFVDKDEVFGLRLQLPNQRIKVTLSGVDGPQGDDAAS